MAPRSNPSVALPSASTLVQKNLIEQALCLARPSPLGAELPDAVGVDEAQQDLEDVQGDIIDHDAWEPACPSAGPSLLPHPAHLMMTPAAIARGPPRARPSALALLLLLLLRVRRRLQLVAVGHMVYAARA